MQIKGQKQKKINRPKPVYTNSYLAAAAWKSGLGLKALMFTFDPTFNPNGSRWDEVLEWCKEFDIDPSRIVYGKSKDQYCKESTAQVVHFKQVYSKELEGCVIFLDLGNAWKLEGELVLEELAEKIIQFPGEQHGELSTLDNKVNAIAKNMWIARRENVDVSKDALLLLQCFDSVKQADVTSFWESNFMWNTKNLTLNKVKEHLQEVKGRTILRDEKKKEYIDSFNNFLKEDD